VKNLFKINTIKNLYLIIIVSFLSHAAIGSETKWTAYFYNDSVNGFQLSDAYETHNMGLKYHLNNKSFVQLDLGIVTPDMFRYDNKFKTANRSFGEIITLKYSFKRIETNKYTIAYFAQFLGQGNFGIDKLQSFAHVIGNIQDDIEILEMVRMPRNIWYGVGTNFKFNRNLILRDSNYKYGFLSYVGTNRISINPYILSEYKYAKFSTFNKIGLDFVLYDKVISAPPISPRIRNYIPYINFGIKKAIGPLEITIAENISLPSIKGDNRLYARLFVSAEISTQNLYKLFSY
jgi:hypothetical protein